MWQNLVHLQIGPAELCIRAGVVFLFILLLLRISGKRSMGQMSATEFVAILLISNAVQNSMNGGDNSLVGGLILASILISLSWGISWLTFRYRKAKHLFEGTPTLLIHRGKVIEKHLLQERMPHSELMMLLRKQGIHDIHEVNSAVLESDASLSVTKNGDLIHKDKP